MVLPHTGWVTSNWLLVFSELQFLIRKNGDVGSYNLRAVVKLNVVEPCLAHSECSVRVRYACKNEAELPGQYYKGFMPSA